LKRVIGYGVDFGQFRRLRGTICMGGLGEKESGARGQTAMRRPEENLG